MNAIVATYLVKVTLRERDDLPEPPPAPTNGELEDIITAALDLELEVVPHVTAERTDQ